MRYPQLAYDTLDGANYLCTQEHSYGMLGPMLDKLLSSRQQEALDQELQILDQGVQRIERAKPLLNGLASLEAYLLQHALEPVRTDVLVGNSILAWLNHLAEGLTGLSSLFRWEIDRRQREGLDGLILEALEDYERRRARGENLPAPPSNLPDERYGDWWAALIECTAVSTWLGVCHEDFPELIQFSPEHHEHKRQQLRELLRQKRELEAEAIREHWLAEQVTVRSNPWKQLFQLRGANAKRFRQAVELGVPRGLLKLRPCWLVDPCTAAQIFPLKTELFDLVIFDEASQCPIEYAIPAVYRGKSLVVSGDAKQLSPTSFFSSSMQAVQEDEEAADDAEAIDKPVMNEDRQLQQINAEFLMTVEDLLEASIGNLPEERLLVHYRSDHPRLIEFSNRAFYHGQLEAPPARMDALNGAPPIHYYHVNGVYHNRTNRDEALKVVELLKDIWLAEGRSPTIGVVTFNLPQRDLIEDLVEKESQVNEAFRARYEQELVRKDERQDVGLFIKNLEDVQGDERDMMIFSTTFGPNANGAFYRRFGPVGAERGERRLNVAVTRAKHRIIVVGSMPIEKISEALGATVAPGMNLKPRCYLQLYLAYAQAVSAGDENQINRTLDRLSGGGCCGASTWWPGVTS
jgi:hypothetical protein